MTIKSLNFRTPLRNDNVKRDLYQQLLVDAIDTYGSGSWKNGMSLHHLHSTSQFSNILIDGNVVGKVVYNTAHDDISMDDYRATHIDKTKLASVSYIAWVNDTDAFLSSQQIVRYRNMLKRSGFTIITMDNKQIKY